MGRFRARRSCLSVPGSSTRFLEKASQVAADALFFDLEDSVAPAAKAEAREMVVATIRSGDFGTRTVCVRVNDLQSEWLEEDVAAVSRLPRLDCLVVPKVERAVDVVRIAGLLDRHEGDRRGRPPVGLDLQIETARGLENAGEIAAASPRNEALHFGPGDFSASMGLPGLEIGGFPGGDPAFWTPFLVRVALAARAHGLQPIDGPYGRVRDLDGLRRSAALALSLGYDGKWALTPDQASALNQAFLPSQADFDRGVALLAAYEEAIQRQRSGAVMLGEEMIDEASRKMAARLVERGRAYGMTPTEPGR